MGAMNSAKTLPKAGKENKTKAEISVVSLTGDFITLWH